MPHQFTHEGKLLVLRCIEKDGTSYGGFKNSTEIGSFVEAPDWDSKPECGKGIHAWPWGMGRDGKDHAGDKIWQVWEACPKSGVWLHGKAKWQKMGPLVYSGPSQAKAVKLIIKGQIAYTTTNARGSAVAGDRGISASAGINSKGMSGKWGCVVLAFWNAAESRTEIRCRETAGGDGSDGKLKAGVWYRLNKIGEFVECPNTKSREGDER